jgi:SAM-dependent methyltransferase
MMAKSESTKLMQSWIFPGVGTLQNRIDEMIRPAVMAGCFITSPTAMVGGLQYHLGGEEDTRQLAELAGISRQDSVLDVCSYLGGPALQLAESYGCSVVGIDISEDFIAAARRIAELAGFSDRVTFQAADARDLAFDDGRFTVVWCQGSLEHDEAWLREFDRVLAPEGRLALTFAIRGGSADAHSPLWTLDDVAAKVHDLGYSIQHLEDLTDRDIKIGWSALDRRLHDGESLFAAALGADWVRDAHGKFADEIHMMRQGQWGNGRIVATKAEAR